MPEVAPIVASKIEPPVPAANATVPTASEQRVPADARIVSIVAPPGYGKTVLAERIHAVRPNSAWLSVDLLDRWPFSFWSHLLASLHRANVEIDDEPVRILTERGPDDSAFLAALCAQLLRMPEPVTLVLDDLDRVEDPGVLAGVEFLVDRAGDRLRLVMTGRVDPRLPLGRWRSAGWLHEIRQSDLRFDSTAAQRFVEQRAPGLLATHDIEALNGRVEGWPMGLQVAVLVAAASDDPAAAVREITGEHRHIADYLTSEVLDSLGEDERDVALGLSVFEWFDPELCIDVLGPGSPLVVRQLLDRQMLTATANGYRFHGLVRELLDADLAWRHPDRRVDLHRRAADALAARDDRFGAARRLGAIGEHASASDVIAAGALVIVDRGEIDDLRRALAALPPDLDVEGAERAIDLGLANVIVGRPDETRRWVERAIARADGSDDRRIRRRLDTLMLIDRFLVGDEPAVLDLIRAYDERDDTSGSDPDDWEMARRHDMLVARAAVPLGLPNADRRVERARRSAAPGHVVDAVAPALDALLALERGDLAVAREAADRSLESADRLPSDEHPAWSEPLLAAGWCSLAAGRFDRAREFAERARAHPFATFPMNAIRADVLAAHVLTRSGAGDAALALLDPYGLPVASSTFQRRSLLVARARALTSSGRGAEAVDLLDGEPTTPAREVALAWALLGTGRREESAALVADAEQWPVPHRIEATMISAMLASGDRRHELAAAAVEMTQRSGWAVSLLGHGPEVDSIVRPSSADPQFPSQRSTAMQWEVRLTEREATLLALLPTHLSYAQMGERLYVSVNTIKTNLKSIYRKLGAASRDEAIRAARSAGLLEESVSSR